ncbi:putative protein phosphatase 2C 25 [Apostasia shenzhenica]|uniref:protein-serine/threonine phosphatase n=1 Tax=Apostasia shenzhenica TaxID=1088818 RepID=A0A2I0BH17_9ASPA|nr:putative protein phosphatase 2C 25 [Apostasia shenzhenica]
MSCSVAVASSPAFSPSMISITRKASTETLALSLQHHLSSSSSSADGSSSPASCSSPFRRFQRGAGGIRCCNRDISTSDSRIFGFSASSCGSSSVLKRKRPARLEIPASGSLALQANPVLDDRVEVEADCARYSVYCKRGRKGLEMEDRHSVALDILGDPQTAFFGIFDGHGGSKAAEFASQKIGELIVEEVLTRGGEGGIELEEAMKNSYLKTDMEFLKEDLRGGACCVTAFVRNGDLIVSNAGDCRAVVSISGKAEALTSDHRPSREDEKDRIESLGGYVDFCRGVWRLQGSLAVSRGIGDSHLKPWVIPEPETKIMKIKSDCEFLILASDGLWDKVSNQEAIDMARPLCLDPQKPSPLIACKKLVNLSVSRGSMDDISVMIIHLGHFI